MGILSLWIKKVKKKYENAWIYQKFFVYLLCNMIDD